MGTGGDVAVDGEPGEGGQPDDELVVDTVLVPVDGSDEADRAVEYAVAIAARYDATVHAMVVLDEESSHAVEGGTIDADAASEEALSVADTVEAIADREGVEFTHSTALGYSRMRKPVHPGSVILDAAEQIEADFLVIPRETGVEDDDVLEKAAEYVLSYASQPVLSV